MNTDLLSLMMFAVITTFTPGPNNITCAVMGLNYGYGKSFRFLLGICGGFFLIMCICSFLAATLLQAVPRVEKIMAIIGAAYITWLAWHTLRANYSFEDQERTPLGFINGFLLQLLNPKVIIYGLTIYSTFLKDIPRNSILLPITAVLLASNCFLSISTWTLFGTVIRRFMRNEKVKLGINITLAVLLLFTAVQISGVMDYLKI